MLAFHEFSSDFLHIYRVYRSDATVFENAQKFRFFTHKPNIFNKTSISDFSKMAIFRGMTTKIEFGENWLYAYVLYYGFGLKISIHNFPQHFFIKIGHIGHFIEKLKFFIFVGKWSFFKSKIEPRGAGNGLMGQHP